MKIVTSWERKGAQKALSQVDGFTFEYLDTQVFRYSGYVCTQLAIPLLSFLYIYYKY
ncbi:MAG: hypothetical protein ACYTX0_54565 [Nostoc sp.]